MFVLPDFSNCVVVLSMVKGRYRQSWLYTITVPLASLSVLGYFAFHAFIGDLGLVEREKLHQQADVLRAELKQLVQEREQLEIRVARLRSATLDADLLKERARISLGYTEPEEIVILLNGTF